MKYFLICFGFILMIHTAAAQNGFLNGYVVLNSGDTLYGRIKDRKEGFSAKLINPIIFKGKRGRDKFRPDELMAYHRGGTNYHSISFSTGNDLLGISRIKIGERQFLKVYISDYLSLYEDEHVDDSGSSFDGNFYLIREDELQFTFVSMLFFKKKLGEYFSDAPHISEAIANRTYRYRDLIRIVNEYNQWYRSERGI